LNNLIDGKKGSESNPKFKSIDGFATEKKISDSYRILIPLYATHIIFVLSLFLFSFPKDL
jgi:hypothetical protein